MPLTVPPKAAASQTTAVAIRDEDINRVVTEWSPEHFRFLFPGSKDEFAAWKQSFALCIIENKELRNALTTDNGKLTLIRAAQRAVSTGLSLNPQEGEGALVAIDGKVEYWPMKNGIIKGALKTGQVDFIASETIFDKDSFTIKKTAHGDDYDFIPALSERGQPRAYFAVIVLKSGRSVVEFQPIDQVQAWMKKYGKGLSNPKSAWNRNFDGMAEKTVLKALLHRVHIASSLDNILKIDDENDDIPDSGSPGDRTPKGTSGDDLAATLAAKAQEGQPAEHAPAESMKQAEPAGEPEFTDNMQATSETSATAQSAELFDDKTHIGAENPGAVLGKPESAPVAPSKKAGTKTPPAASATQPPKTPPAKTAAPATAPVATSHPPRAPASGPAIPASDQFAEGEGGDEEAIF